MGIERFEARPDALNYLEHWYQPTGKLRIPVVTLHTTRDPIVPVQHECVFRGLVGEDRAEHLAQFEVDGFGHCELLTLSMTPPYFAANDDFAQQIFTAFSYLVAWCEAGRKPPEGIYPLTPLQCP
jgi:hypothetical protein